MSRSRAVLGALALGLIAAAASAEAQPNPQFKFEEKPAEPVRIVEWKASAQAGLILTTGNSQSTSLSAGLSASRKAGLNKLSIEGGLAFARSTLLIANDANGNGVLDGEGEIERETQTITEAYTVTARYDRFLTESNSLYAAAKIAADEPAGKELVFGGQVGYSRQVYKDETHELRSEIGYDFSREDLVVGEASSIHSVRGFAGYTGKLSEDTGLAAQIEALLNLNPVENAAGEAATFEDTRILASTSLTTKMFEDISFRFGITLKWDNFPAPRPPLPIPYAPDFVPVADELDTVAEASLILSFL
jgi:putative salt-induced outer membrane protein YdiY